MSTHKTKLIANNIMNITQQAIDDAITIEMFNKSTDPDTQKTLKDYVDKHIATLTEEYDKGNIQELYNKLMEEMEVTYSDTYNKLTYNSIT